MTGHRTEFPKICISPSDLQSSDGSSQSTMLSSWAVGCLKPGCKNHQGGPSKTPAPYFLLPSEYQGVAATFSAMVYDVILRSDGIEGLILSEIQSFEAEIVNESILRYPQYNSNLFSKVVNELLARFTVVLEEGHSLLCERDMLMHFN
jgi:hypothetical protein